MAGKNRAASPPAGRDSGVDIAKGIGILFVVGGHCGVYLTGFPASSFHIQLFYFISGFFIQEYICQKGSPAVFLRKKFVRLLVPYFIYNLAFALITWLQQFIGINYQADSFLKLVNFHNLFVEPFLSGHQYQIACALWFVPSLFLVMCIVCVTRDILSYAFKNKFYQMVCIILCIALYYMSCHVTFGENKYIAVLCRTFIGYVWCVCGLIYYQYKLKINDFILLIAASALYVTLEITYGGNDYSVVWNIYSTGVSQNISFLVSLSGILIVIAIANIASKYGQFINKNTFEILGRNSFHIMAVHLSFFLFLNIIIVLVSPVLKLSDITSIYFRCANPAIFYFAFSVALCWLYIRLLEAWRLAGCKHSEHLSFLRVLPK